MAATDVRLDSPLIEYVADSMRIEEVARDRDKITYRIVLNPAPRIRSLAGLIPILTFPC